MTKNDEYDSTQTPVIVWTDFHILPEVNALDLYDSLNITSRNNT
jgi:hypothetical protein